MSSGKPTTPISLPKLPKGVKLNAPATPPSKTRSKRLLGTYLKTPDQNSESVPFSPSLKRSSSGSFKSPDYKLNTNNNTTTNVPSPYSSNLLKTPRHTGYDSDDEEHPKSKFQKTPQFFSPGKKLFTNDDSKEDLNEISSKIKNRLSSAFDKLQNDSTTKERPTSLTFTDLSLNLNNNEQSPTKKLKPSMNEKWSPSLSVQKANLNLQTLQQSPLPKSSPTFSQYSKFDGARQTLFQEATIQPNSQRNHPEGSLKQSPVLVNDHEERIILPSPDEELSAQNALLAALSRQQRRKSKSFSSNSSPKRKSFQSLNEPAIVLPTVASPNTPPSLSSKNQPSVKLPSLNMALNPKENISTPKSNNTPLNNEQDAVLSLMSLSSPQSLNFNKSQVKKQHTPSSSRSSSVASPQLPSTLPPITGLIHGATRRTTQVIDDNDATDIEEDEGTDDDHDSTI